jgi:imidazolonepropionase
MRDLAIIENGAVLTRGELIAAVGHASEVERLASADATQMDASGRVVLPGFVDAHTHPVFAGTREDEYEMRAAGETYSQIAARGGGIRSTVRKTRAANEDALFESSLSHVSWLLKHGTTTAEAKSGYGLTVEDELKILRVISRLNREASIDLVPTFLGAHEVPEEFRGSDVLRKAYVQLVTDEMMPEVVSSNLAEFADVFCETGVFTADESRRILLRARELGLGLRIHADQLSLSGGAVLAAELGAATADHLEWTDEAGISALARAGVTPVLLPGAVFNLGLTRYPAARAMIEAGLPVVLATDFNPGSSPTPSLQMILSIACSQMRMSPAETITASTINAAYSLNRGSSVGSLEPGKKADMVVYDCEDYRQIPYFYGVNHASVVIKAGRII